MESCLVLVDNSEWTRNSDYSPTRFQAQADAVNLLAGAKTEANPENTVGVLTMAGKTPQVLVTPTPDLGKVLNSMQSLEIEGSSNLSSAVQIAQLALKHRQNKNQRQRVVIFVGSPVQEDKDKLVKIAKKLKKNNVAVDIVSFGSEAENEEKLQAFMEAVNSGDNSHMVTVPPGTILSDALFSTPIFMGEHAVAAAGGEGGAAAGAAGQRDGYQFGVDPNLDPELAAALRASMEEEQARQAAADAAAGEGAAAGPTPPAGTAAGTPAAAAAAGGSGPEPMDEDELLQQALAMSMQANADQAEQAPAAPAKPKASAGAGHHTTGEGEEDSEMADGSEELQRALQMSMEEHGDTSQPPAGPSSTQQMLNDPDYLNSVLGSLPGVNPQDPALQSALQNLRGGSRQQGDDKDGKASDEASKEKK